MILLLLITLHGITLSQLTEDKIKLYASKNSSEVELTCDSKSLVPDPSNNYLSDTGGIYKYSLSITGVENIGESGKLRIRIDDQLIYDRANNCNDETTSITNFYIDNSPPTIGIITTNANEYNRVIDEEILLSIDNCFDESGIAKYEWQYSPDETNWTTIHIDNSSASSSSATHSLFKDSTANYRVIVSDILGNSIISKTATVEYMTSFNKAPTIRHETTLLTSNTAQISILIKSSSPIVSLTVSGSELLNAASITKNNLEITTTLDHIVSQNGVYEIVCKDERGNIATDKVTISFVDLVTAIISYEKYNASIHSSAKIVFTSDTLVKIVNPSSYTGITFDTTDFSTKIVATVDETVDFSTEKIFTFANRSFKSTDVIVKPPLLTKWNFIRTYREDADEMNVTTSNAYILTNEMDNNLFYIDTRAQTYYGTEINALNPKIATSEDIDISEKLGMASNIYTLSENGIKDLKSTSSELLPLNSKYVNSNKTGVCKSTANTLEWLPSYDTSLPETTETYKTFRIVIKIK